MELDGAQPRRLDPGHREPLQTWYRISVLSWEEQNQTESKRKAPQSKLSKELSGTCMENGLFEGKKRKWGNMGFRVTSAVQARDDGRLLMRNGHYGQIGDVFLKYGG